MVQDNARQPLRRALFALAGAVLLLGTSEPARAQVPFEVLVSRPNLSKFVQTAEVGIANSDAELVTLWRKTGAGGAPPPVNFRRHSAIVYFAGWKPDSGYRISIENVRIRGGTMELGVMERVAGSRCVVSLASVQPGVLILTIPWKRDVVPVVDRVVTDCD